MLAHCTRLWCTYAACSVIFFSLLNITHLICFNVQVEMILNQRLKELPPVVRPEALQMIAKKVTCCNNSFIMVHH